MTPNVANKGSYILERQENYVFISWVKSSGVGLTVSHEQGAIKLVYVQGVPRNMSHFVFAYISASWAATAKVLYFFLMACPCKLQNYT
jgi:hypothetical protein